MECKVVAPSGAPPEELYDHWQFVDFAFVRVSLCSLADNKRLSSFLSQLQTHPNLHSPF